MLQGAPKRWDALAAALYADPTLPFAEAEARHLRASHAEYGDALCAQWGFPESLRSVVRHHHAPELAVDGIRPLDSLVHVANALAAAAGVGLTRTVPADAPAASACERIGATPAILEEIAASIAEDVATLLPQLDGE